MQAFLPAPAPRLAVLVVLQSLAALLLRRPAKNADFHVVHIDGAIQHDTVAAYGLPGRPVKTVFNAGSELAHAALCGPGARVALLYDGPRSAGGWRYIDGKPQCMPAPTPAPPR